MKESAIVAKIRKALRERYPLAYIRKLADAYTRGLPDMLFIWVRQQNAVRELCVLFIEVKRPGKKREPLQAHEADLLNYVGVMSNHGELAAICVSSAKEVLAKLEEWGMK